MIHHIVCMARNRVIGDGEAMLWHIPEDLRRFKKITMGSSLVMGRKTWCSLPGKLPGRAHVVLTRRAHAGFGGDFDEDIHACAHMDEAFCRAKELSSTGEIFVIGGGEVYRLTLPYITNVYMTYLHKDFFGDITYPVLDEERFQEALAETITTTTCDVMSDATKSHGSQEALTVSYKRYQHRDPSLFPFRDGGS